MLRLRVLTTDSDGVLEDLCHLRIHLNHDVLLLGHLVVPDVHLVLDPVREMILENTRADIGNPLLRCLWQFK